MQDHKFGAQSAGDVLAHWNLKVLLVECFIYKAIEAYWKIFISSVISCILSNFAVFVLFPPCNAKKLFMNKKVVLSIHLASFKTIHTLKAGTLQAVFSHEITTIVHIAFESPDAFVHKITQFAEHCNNQAGKMDMHCSAEGSTVPKLHLAVGRFGFQSVKQVTDTPGHKRAAFYPAHAAQTAAWLAASTPPQSCLWRKLPLIQLAQQIQTLFILLSQLPINASCGGSGVESTSIQHWTPGSRNNDLCHSGA